MNKRIAAGGLALALATSGLAAPQAVAQGVPALVEGNLNWPIKDSFINYLNMPFAKGAITATEGAKQVGNSFDLPLDAEDSRIDANGNGTLEFDGKLQFQAHPTDDAWGMDVTFDDVKVKVNGENATITADFLTKGALPGQEAKDVEGDDAVLATFTLEEAIAPAVGASYSASDLPSVLGEGAETALKSYKAGSEGGNVDLDLKFGEVPAASSGSDNGGSSTGGIIAIIVGILAALGAVGAAVANSGLLRF